MVGIYVSVHMVCLHNEMGIGMERADEISDKHCTPQLRNIPVVQGEK